MIHLILSANRGGYSHARKTRGQRAENKISRKAFFKRIIFHSIEIN